MGLTIDFHSGWRPELQSEIELAVRRCIGETPVSEIWSVSITGGFGQYCEVQIVTPNQKRTRLFFEEPANLPKAIAGWIDLYPLR